ncbi:MAG: SemiSWEET family sugar transporter [Rhizomicrobium sp.]
MAGHYRWKGSSIVSNANLLGAAAALASTISFAPQAWRIIRTGETHAISAAMYTITVVGFALWAAYGVVLGQWPLVASNSVCLALSGFILAMKLLPKRKKKEVSKTASEILGSPKRGR